MDLFTRQEITMSKDKILQNKLHYLYCNFEALFLFTKEKLHDTPKRVLLRRFFIILNNFLKIAPEYKNTIYKNNRIDKKVKKNIENILKKVNTDFKYIDGKNKFVYSLIRNKLTAHQQQDSNHDRLLFWSEIDLTTITIFYDEIEKIFNLMKMNKPNMIHFKIEFNDLFSKYKNASIDNTDLAGGTQNTVGMMPLSKVQEYLAIINTLNY